MHVIYRAQEWEGLRIARGGVCVVKCRREHLSSRVGGVDQKTSPPAFLSAAALVRFVKFKRSGAIAGDHDNVQG